MLTKLAPGVGLGKECKHISVLLISLIWRLLYTYINHSEVISIID